jgi:hypothetical protein
MRWGFEDAAATLHRIRGEFREMPGLKLTIAQAARLWQLDPDSSREFLDALVMDGMLRRKADGVYLVASDTTLDGVRPLPTLSHAKNWEGV